MQRIARFGRLKPEAVEEYRRLHQAMSDALRDAHRAAGFRNFSIYIRGLELYSYVECDNWEQALQAFSAMPIAQAWSSQILKLLDAPLEWEVLEEIWSLD